MLSEDISSRNLNFESYKERITNFSNEFELGLFLYIVKRSLIWIILCVTASLAAAHLYLRYTAPQFESKSIIQVRERNTAKQVLSMSTFNEDRNMQADVELMRSRYFVSKALKKLPLEVSYFNRGQVLTEEFYTRTFWLVKDLNVIDQGILDVPIYINLSRPDRLALSYTIGSTPYNFDISRRAAVITPHFTCRVEITDVGELVEGDNSLVLFMRINSPGYLVNRYVQRVQVAIADPGAKTILISSRDENPALARDLAQAMAETFIEFELDRQTESAESIIQFIRTQKDTVYNQLRESESKLQAFKMDSRVAQLEQLTPIFLERQKTYEDEMVSLTMQIDLLRAIERATNRPIDEINAYDLFPLLIGTDFERSLSETIKTLQQLLDEREAIYLEATDRNMGVRNLENRISVQKQVVLESIGSLRRRAEDRRMELEAVLRDFEGQFSSLPEKELQYSRIERVFSINEKYYTQLLEKDIEYRISKAGSVTENRILEDAVVATTPLSPKRNMIYTSYLVTGIIVSLLIVLLRYILHDNITSLHDIAKLSHASIGILGMIPKYKQEIPVSQLLIDKNPKSLIAESFRSVRTNLQFVDNTPGPKMIAITSTISGEGKTFVAMNLAGIIAISGKKVIILDLDMRKPKIHLGFGVANDRGMSTLLIGKDTFENCIRHSELEGLDFITAGPIPPNPSELIISDRMNTLLDELFISYDLVLVDNPPVGLVTDGIPMIQRADYPIYIFRSDYSKKQFVQNVDRLINENSITRLSTILNGVDIDRNKYGYNYGYGYGYGYGQGYGGGYYEERTSKKDRKKGLLSRIFGKA